MSEDSTQNSEEEHKTQDGISYTIPYDRIDYDDYMNWYETTSSSTDVFDWNKETDSMVSELMGKTNPKTKTNYSKEEAEKIVGLIKDRAFGFGRFNSLSFNTSASAISSVVDFEDDDFNPDLIDSSTSDGKTMWRYLFKVADDKMKGKHNKSGTLKGYTKESHLKGAEKFIGRPLVIGHDGDFEGGLIENSWADDNGDVYQVFRVYNEKFKNMIDKGYRPSIRTYPTKYIDDDSKIDEYEALHTSLIFPNEKPGCDTGGLIDQLESSVGTKETETDLKEEQEMDKETYTKAELEAIVKSSVSAVKEEFQAEIQELKIATVKSSIATAHGTDSEILDKIAKGGEEALTAFESAISSIKDATKQTVISQKSVQTDNKEDDADESAKKEDIDEAVISTIPNSSEEFLAGHEYEKELKLTQDDKDRFAARAKAIGLRV